MRNLGACALQFGMLFYHFFELFLVFPSVSTKQDMSPLSQSLFEPSEMTFGACMPMKPASQVAKPKPIMAGRQKAPTDLCRDTREMCHRTK